MDDVDRWHQDLDRWHQDLIVKLDELEYRAGHGTLTPLFESLNAVGAQVNRISIVEDGGTRQLSCDISGIGREAMGDIIAALRSRAEVLSAESSAR